MAHYTDRVKMNTVVKEAAAVAALALFVCAVAYLCLFVFGAEG